MFQQYEAELQEVLADAEARLGALLAAADTADRSGACLLYTSPSPRD